MSEWQPIETAPKDGTSFLVWFRGEIFVASYRGVWHPDNVKLVVRSPNIGPQDDMRTVEVIEPPSIDGHVIPGAFRPVTHWMPLPEPPHPSNPERRGE